MEKIIRTLLAAGMITAAGMKEGSARTPPLAPEHTISSTVEKQPPRLRHAQDFTDDFQGGDAFGDHADSYDFYDFGQQARLDKWIAERNPRFAALRNKIDAGIRRLLSAAGRCNEERPDISRQTIRRVERQLGKVLGGRGSLLPIDKNIFDSLSPDTPDGELDARVGVERLQEAEDIAEQILRDVENMIADPEVPRALKHILEEQECLVS